MIKKSIFLGMLCATTLTWAQPSSKTTTISEFNLSGPYAVVTPFAADTVDVNGKKFDEQSLLSGMSLSSEAATKVVKAGLLPSLREQKSVGVLSFFLNNTSFLKGKLEVKGPKHYKLFVDGQEAKDELNLAPEHHTVAIKFMAEPNDTDSVSVNVTAQEQVAWTLSKTPLYGSRPDRRTSRPQHRAFCRRCLCHRGLSDH